MKRYLKQKTQREHAARILSTMENPQGECALCGCSMSTGDHDSFSGSISLSTDEYDCDSYGEGK